MSKYEELSRRANELRTRIAELNIDLEDRNMVDGRGHRLTPAEAYDRKQTIKRTIVRTEGELAQVRADLRRYSSVGRDPTRALLARAYQILDGLDEQGVDIGERGIELLEDIEAHVPPEMLVAAHDGDRAAE